MLDTYDKEEMIALVERLTTHDGEVFRLLLLDHQLSLWLRAAATTKIRIILVGA